MYRQVCRIDVVARNTVCVIAIDNVPNLATRQYADVCVFLTLRAEIKKVTGMSALVQ
jgi:hypothetical protein